MRHDPATRARVAVSVLFLVNGAFLASVLPRLPALKAGLGLTNAELGSAIAAMPLGGLLAGGLAGLLIARLGSGRLAVACAIPFGALLGPIGLAPGWLALAATFLVLGMLDAVMDAAENAHGLAVERRYGRSILQGFHGWWSAGTLVGAATGTLAAALHVPIALHLALAGALLAGAAIVASRWLLPHGDADRIPDETPIAARDVPRIVRVLAPVALVGVLGVMLEDAAQTWSAVYLADVLDTGPGIAGVAFVCYTVAMTLGRLSNDRWVDGHGTARVARVGAFVAAAGVALVVVGGAGPGLVAAVPGFVLVGLGAAPLFPVMVTAAAARPGVPTGHAVALVSWIARVGFVVAPLLVGAAADAAGLAAAFGVPLLAALAAAVLAPALLAGGAARPRPLASGAGRGAPPT